MPTESDEVTRNGDLNNVGVDEEGFQKVLTQSEKRVLKKKSVHSKRVTLGDCNSLENSIVSRLKKRGLDLTNDPDHVTLETVTVENEELEGMLGELDEAITGVLLDVQKPDQNLTVTELDNRIRVAKNNLSQMKTRKKGTYSEEELNNASKETEVYITYLQQQISLTKEYQKLKNAQNGLMRLKNAIKGYLGLKLRLKNNVEKKEKKPLTPTGENKVLGTTKRSMEYVYEFIKELKDKQGETLEQSELVSQDYKVLEGSKFQPPYTYLQKLKQKFDVFIDRTGSKQVVLSIYGTSKDVKRCMEYLSNLDLSAQNKVQVSYSKYKTLLNMESEYNVLLNYNGGVMEVLGSTKDAKAFLEHVETKENSTQEKEKEKEKERENSKESDVSDVTENEKMYDYYVLRALSGKFRSNVREIETEYGVAVKFDLTQRNGLAKVAFVPLLDNSVDKCIEKFTNYIQEYGYKDLGKLSNEELNFISDNEVLKKRYRSQYTTLVKTGEKVYVVGLKKYLNVGYHLAKQLLESRQVAPSKVKVTQSQYQLLQPHMTSLQDQKGTYITTSVGKDKEKDKLVNKNEYGKNMEHKNKKELEGGSKEELLRDESGSGDLKEKKEKDKEKEVLLYVYGSSQQQKETLAVINEMLGSFVSRELSMSGVEYNVLLEEKKVQELETKYKVKTLLNKNSMSVSGPKTQVELMVDEVKALFRKVEYFNVQDQKTVDKIKNQSYVYSSMAVPQKSLGKVIGKGGSTLKQILLQSSINNIVITKAYQSQFTQTKVEGMSNGSTTNSQLEGVKEQKEKKGKLKEKESRERDKEVDVLLMIGNGLGVYLTIGLVKQVLESEDETPLGKEMRTMYDEYTSKHSIMRRSSTNNSTVTQTKTNYKTQEKLDINDLDNFPSL